MDAETNELPQSRTVTKRYIQNYKQEFRESVAQAFLK